MIFRATALLIVSLPLLAQVDTATITGTVVDRTGAAVAGAKIAATSQTTSLEYKGNSGEGGVYVITALPIGSYDLVVSGAGFQTVRRRNITLDAGTRVRVDVQMSLGQVSEVVEVSGQVPLLESETSNLGQVIENRTITQMPLNGRNYQHLAILSAGVLPSRVQNFVDDAFSANGASHDQNVFTLDGGDNNNYFSGIVVATNEVVKPSIDSIQEFKLDTHNYGAEFGRGGGAVVQVTTKSGTNQLHGSLFEFVRNDKFDANNFFNSGRPKPPYRQNQYGGTVGGPVMRDKLFFFGSYEGTRTREKITTLSTIPTPAQIGGNFGSVNIFDPATQAANGSRSQFPGNVIPANRLDPVAIKELQLYPLPNRPGVQNYVFNSPRNLNTDKGDGKFDWRINDNNTVFARLSVLKYFRLEPGKPALARQRHRHGRPRRRRQERRAELDPHLPRRRHGERGPHRLQPHRRPHRHAQHRAALEDVRLQGQLRPVRYQRPPLVLDRRVQGDRRPQLRSRPAQTGRAAVRRHVLLEQGQARLEDGREHPKLHPGQQDHQLRARRVHLQRPVHTVGGRRVGGRRRHGRRSSRAHQQRAAQHAARCASARLVYEAYIQDNWKITPKLTLNIGLRYEYQSPYVEQNNRAANFVINSSDPSFGKIIAPRGDGSDQRSFRGRDFNNFAPRIGFAYQLDTKTVVRASYGIFYQGTFLLPTGATPEENPPYYLQVNIPTATSSPTSLVTIRDGFAPGALNPTVLDGRSLAAVWPYTWSDGVTNQWNFNVQRSLPKNTLLSVAYVGSNTVHIMIGTTDINQPVPGPGANNPRRAFPQFADIEMSVPLGGANYQALESRFEHRFSGGFSIVSGYTFSKTLEGGIGQLSSVLATGEAALRSRICRTVSSQPWCWIFRSARAAIGSREACSRRSWAAGSSLPILELQSGLNVNPTINGNPTNTTGGIRPDRLRDGNLPRDQRTPDRWFDPSAFAVPGPFLFGNSAANVIYGPGLENLDLTIARTFRLNERLALDFRSEFFNLFNEAHFSFPNAVVNTSSAGTISTTASSARQIQFGLKLIF